MSDPTQVPRCLPRGSAGRRAPSSPQGPAGLSAAPARPLPFTHVFAGSSLAASCSPASQRQKAGEYKRDFNNALTSEPLHDADREKASENNALWLVHHVAAGTCLAIYALPAHNAGITANHRRRVRARLRLLPSTTACPRPATRRAWVPKAAVRVPTRRWNLRAIVLTELLPAHGPFTQREAAFGWLQSPLACSRAGRKPCRASSARGTTQLSPAPAPSTPANPPSNAALRADTSRPPNPASRAVCCRWSGMFLHIQTPTHYIAHTEHMHTPIVRRVYTHTRVAQSKTPR